MIYVTAMVHLQGITMRLLRVQEEEQQMYAFTNASENQGACKSYMYLIDEKALRSTSEYGAKT